MDDWQIPTQPLPAPPPQPRMPATGVGPVHGYHPMRARPSPYPMQEMKATYPYQQASIPAKPNVYTPLAYPPTHMEQIPQQQRLVSGKSAPGPISTYNAGQQQMLSARARSMPYPSPNAYAHPTNTACHCTGTGSHVHYPPQQHVYYPNYYSQSQPLPYQQNSTSSKFDTMKYKAKPSTDEPFSSPATSYHPSVCSNPYVPAQQLTPQPSAPSTSMPAEYQTFSNQSQIFPSPPSNPSTPYQGEFNADFGVPYHQGQPSSVNSLTDALCPGGDAADRQLTPGPPSVGTPRVAQHQYSFPQTPLTPTTSRLSSEPNIDELTAFLQDPVNIYLTDDLTSTLFDDIEVLADTYLGGRTATDQSTSADSTLDYDIILNYLCSDDLISTVCQR